MATDKGSACEISIFLDCLPTICQRHFESVGKIWLKSIGWICSVLAFANGAGSALFAFQVVLEGDGGIVAHLLCDMQVGIGSRGHLGVA